MTKKNIIDNLTIIIILMGTVVLGWGLTGVWQARSLLQIILGGVCCFGGFLFLIVNSFID